MRLRTADAVASNTATGHSIRSRPPKAFSSVHRGLQLFEPIGSRSTPKGSAVRRWCCVPDVRPGWTKLTSNPSAGPMPRGASVYAASCTRWGARSSWTVVFRGAMTLNTKEALLPPEHGGGEIGEVHRTRRDGNRETPRLPEPELTSLRARGTVHCGRDPPALRDGDLRGGAQQQLVSLALGAAPDRASCTAV